MKFLACLALICGVNALATTVPAEVSQRLAMNDSVDVIVEYDATVVDRDLARMRTKLPRGISDDALLALTSRRYQQSKDAVDRALHVPEADVLLDYSHLPMRALRVRSAGALAALAAHANVRSIYPDTLMQRVQSDVAPGLVQIDQPAVAAVGYQGAGTTVAVIDDGIDITNPAFACTAVGTPAGCRIVANQTFVSTPVADFSHGTNVSAIVASVAPEANVAMLNVFTSSGASTSTIISAINWAIANRTAYNIVAINMSLGDASHRTSACSTGNSYLTPVNNARTAGISVVVAAGNSAYLNNAFTPGIASPACTPGVISVGAVYNGNVGGLVWGASPNQCTDNATQLDQITCFSQSASILTMLAPGALITAGGILEGGTSQASPHVAGAVAVLRAAFRNDSLATTQARLTTSSVNITDPRNGVTKPRLMLDVAAQPANDTFTTRQALSGSSGSTTGTNLLASVSTDKSPPASAGTSPVWWTWTAPASGQVTLSTAGSNFATQLAAYTGSSLASLQRVASAANVSATDATSQLLFQAQSGVSYQWAVGSAGTASGNVALQWSLNTAAAANLTSNISGPATALAGSTATYILSVKNNGPQTATNVNVTLNIPAGASVTGSPNECTAVGATVACTVSTLANGATASWTLRLTISDPGSGLVLSSNVVSDVPNPNAGGSASTITVQPGTVVGNDNGDVPIPPWALLLLALGMCGTLVQASRARAFPALLNR